MNMPIDLVKSSALVPAGHPTPLRGSNAQHPLGYCGLHQQPDPTRHLAAHSAAVLDGGCMRGQPM